MLSGDNLDRYRNTKLTLEELESSSTTQANNKYSYSAFSTAAHQQSVDNRYNRTNDRIAFRKNLFTQDNSSLSRYKKSLQEATKQFQDVPAFKKTLFEIPNFQNMIEGKQPQSKTIIYETNEEDQSKINLQQSQQKQNNFYHLNTGQKIDIGSKIGGYMSDKKSLGSVNTYTQWKTATKSETAEIVRNLFGNSGLNLSLQYRKKKFFQNFCHANQK